jgi:hypothetical protein
MKLPQRVGLALLAWVGCCSLAAQTNTKWEVLSLSDQGMFYIDPKSITEEDGRKKVDSALDYKKPQSTADGKAYQSAQSQLQINCRMKMARVIHQTYYTGPMLTGKVVMRQGMLHEWMAIDPSSPVQKIARRVC